MIANTHTHTKNTRSKTAHVCVFRPHVRPLCDRMPIVDAVQYICVQCSLGHQIRGRVRWRRTSTMTRSARRDSSEVFNYILHFTRYAGQIIRCDTLAHAPTNIRIHKHIIVHKNRLATVVATVPPPPGGGGGELSRIQRSESVRRYGKCTLHATSGAEIKSVG